MSQNIPLPQFDPDVQEAVLGTWLKQPGDSLHVGDVVAEVTTDKANIEVESPFDGTLEAHLVEEGATVTVGQTIASITAS